MTSERPRGRPGIGFWLIIASSALVGTWSRVTRPGFDPGDLVLPMALAISVAIIIVSLKVFFPAAVADPVRNSWLLIGLSALVILVALVLGFMDA